MMESIAKFLAKKTAKKTKKTNLNCTLIEQVTLASLILHASGNFRLY